VAMGVQGERGETCTRLLLGRAMGMNMVPLAAVFDGGRGIPFAGLAAEGNGLTRIVERTRKGRRGDCEFAEDGSAYLCAFGGGGGDGGSDFEG